VTRRDAGVCVISGFHSGLEKDILRFLLKGRQPVVVVLARRLYDRMPQDWADAVTRGRFLIVSTSNAARASESTTRQRNRFILDHADRVVLGSLTSDGNLADLVSTLPINKVTVL